MRFQKLKTKLIACRDYKNLNSVKCRADTVTTASNVDNFVMYKSTILNIFNRDVPIKKKDNHANEAFFVSKKPHKAIMKRSRLRNLFLKHQSDINKETKTLKEIFVSNF